MLEEHVGSRMTSGRDLQLFIETFLSTPTDLLGERTIYMGESRVQNWTEEHIHDAIEINATVLGLAVSGSAFRMTEPETVEMAHYVYTFHPGEHPRSVLLNYLLAMVRHAPNKWRPIILNDSSQRHDTTANEGIAYHCSSCVRRMGWNFFHQNQTISPPEAITLRHAHPRTVRTLCLSDTHGYLHKVLEIVRKYKTNARLVVHAGDLSYEESRSARYDRVCEKVSSIPDVCTYHELGGLFSTILQGTMFAEELKNLNAIKTAVGAEHALLCGGNHDAILAILGQRTVSIDNMPPQTLADALCSIYGVTYLDGKDAPRPINFGDGALRVWGSGMSHSKADVDDPKSGNVAFQIKTGTFAAWAARAERHQLRFADLFVIHECPLPGSRAGPLRSDLEAYYEWLRSLNPYTVICGHEHIDEKRATLLKTDAEPFIVNASCCNRWNAFADVPLVIVDVPLDNSEPVPLSPTTPSDRSSAAGFHGNVATPTTSHSSAPSPPSIGSTSASSPST
jgi:hypothetical protein